MAFNQSAQNINLQFRGDGPYLVADLATVDGTYRTDALRLDNWVANLHGNFSWVAGGNFSATAQNVGLTDGGATLTAVLGFGTGETRFSSTSLADHVTNSGGFFQVINI